MSGSDSQSSHSEDGSGIAARVRRELDKNGTLTAWHLCKILELDYKVHGDYVAHVRSAWKYDPKNEHGLKCSIHAWRGWVDLPVVLGPQVRLAAEMKGWLKTRARNRWLLWRDQLGRLQWFETGRVNVYLRKPASYGGYLQLLCKAFSWTGLIADLNVLQAMFKGLHFKGAHYVFDLGYRGEKPVTVDLFGPSSGVVVKLFDKTHPTSLEILAHYPDWQERNERLLKELRDVFLGFRDVQGPHAPKGPDNPYWV